MIANTGSNVVLWCKGPLEILVCSPPVETANVGRVGKNCVFRPIEKSGSDGADNLCLSTTVVSIYGSALVEEYVAL